jgi:hypothetical protein
LGGIENPEPNHNEKENTMNICPLCDEESPYVNVGKAHIGYCLPCGVSFIIGANLFSSWQDETEDEQRAAYDAAGIESLRRIA